MRSLNRPQSWSDLRKRSLAGIAVLLTVIGAACAARQPGDPLRPGFNLYSPEQDIALGREAAAQVRQQVDVVDDPELQAYITQLGKKLAAHRSAGEYPYSFTLINEEGINAFALPGGPIFMNTGTLEAADNEAQFAGVLAHEIAHVALRHGTNQASKSSLAQIPAVLAGSAIGQGSVLAQLGQLGLGLGVNSLLLKYSRDAEREADAMGARLLAAAGYDPVAMAHFFEKLEAEGGQRAPEFLSSHPNPGNRVQAVQAEIQTLPLRDYQATDGAFPAMKREVAALPPPERSARDQQAAVAPAQPSGGCQTIQTSTVAFEYPAGWQAFGDRTSAVLTIAPSQGLVRNQRGGISMGYGIVASYYRPQTRQSLRQATDELIRELGQLNPNLRSVGQQREVSVSGQPGLLTTLVGASPYGGREANWILTAPRPEGIFYVVFVAPEDQVQGTRQTLDRILRSIRFTS